MKQLPSPLREPERYRGRPLLIVLENFVLSSIGHLDAAAEPAVAAAVKKVFGGGDDWHATIRQVLHLEDGIEDQFRLLWNQNRTAARETGATIHPIQFAKAIADVNFVPLLDQPSDA